ncbi:MAG: hypothetical protein Q7K26_01870 [bacterium]|nr:hypothetical protein [bacterium]
MHKVSPIDVGFGGVKYGQQTKSDELMCRSFASLCPTAFHASNDTSPIDVVHTLIDDITYVAGNEAHLALSGLAFGRVQSTNYARTAEYQALVNAALFYIDRPIIDVLVLGLPVSTFPHEKQALFESMKGIHQYSRTDRNDTDGRKLFCDVKNVLVLRQPMGGLYDVYSTEKYANALTNGKTLVLDPGFFTLDWIVANNKKPIEDRCGASNNGGVSAIYKAVANELQRETNEQVDISRVEEAYNGTGIIRVSGEKINLSKYDNLARGVLNQVLNEMESKIKTYSDLENIVVVGGAAELYKRILQPRVPKFDIIVPDHPMFSNVRGFQVAGEIWAANNLS